MLQLLHVGSWAAINIACSRAVGAGECGAATGPIKHTIQDAVLVVRRETVQKLVFNLLQ